MEILCSTTCAPGAALHLPSSPSSVGLQFEVTLILSSHIWTSHCCAAAGCRVGTMSFCKDPHTHIPSVPGSEFSLCFKDSWYGSWCVILQGKGFTWRGLLINNLHLNSWRMGAQEEEQLLESDIVMDQVRMRDSRDRLMILVARCIPVNREVNAAYYGG